MNLLFKKGKGWDPFFSGGGALRAAPPDDHTVSDAPPYLFIIIADILHSIQYST